MRFPRSSVLGINASGQSDARLVHGYDGAVDVAVSAAEGLELARFVQLYGKRKTQ